MSSSFSNLPFSYIISTVGISSLFPRPYFRQNVYIPPYLARSGFGVLFGYATYMFACGDSRNGSGFATCQYDLSFYNNSSTDELPRFISRSATTLMYLFMNFTKSIKAPRHPLSLALTGGAAACAALYGTEYFYFQDRLV